MSFHSVSDMLERAGSEVLLDTLSPEDFVDTIAEHLLVLEGEFSGITLRISKSNVPRFCADLKAGQYERVIEHGIAQGHDPKLLRAVLDPETFDLPIRIATYAAIYPSVELNLSSQQARLIGHDLIRGAALRSPKSDKDTPPC